LEEQLAETKVPSEICRQKEVSGIPMTSVKCAKMWRTKHIWSYLLFALAIGIAAILYTHLTQTSVAGWDPVAYLHAGQRLAQGKAPAICHPYNDFIGPYFTLTGFNVQIQDNECLYLNYPPGFPLILAISQVLTISPETPLYVPAFFGVLGLIGTFIVGAIIYEPTVGALGALILALTPSYIAFSTSPWSDVPATALLIGGIASYLKGTRQKGKRGQILGGTIGGGLIAWSIFTRYANAVALLPLAAYIGVTQKRRAFRDRATRTLFVCTLLTALGVLLFNHMYYGGYLTTSYSPQHGWYTWPAFSLQYILGKSPVGERSLIAIAQTAWENFAWMLTLGIWGLMQTNAQKRILILGGILAFFGLYAGYAFPATGINARFILPAFPCISIAVGYGLWHGGPRRWRWWWRGSGTMILGLVLLAPLPNLVQGLVDRNIDETARIETIVQLVQDSEPNAVFLAYSTNDTIRYHGERSTLLYRRIPSLDTSGQQSPKVFENQLIPAVNALLEDEIPVYYVQDSDPPLWKSRTILESHFELCPLDTKLPMYRVQPLSTDAPTGSE
jgi:hypothetical protein